MMRPARRQPTEAPAIAPVDTPEDDDLFVDVGDAEGVPGPGVSLATFGPGVVEAPVVGVAAPAVDAPGEVAFDDVPAPS